MFTEEEAKGRMCPYMMPAALVVSCEAANQHGSALSDEMTAKMLRSGHCAASGCMAWRWASQPIERQELDVGKQPEPDAKKKGWETPTTTLLGRVVWERKQTPRGFCGLAGHPHPTSRE